MKNYVQPGDVIPVVAGTGGVKSGDVVVAGNLIGVAASDAAGRWPIGNAVRTAGSNDDEAYVRLPGIPVVVEGT
jgi:hypothetical protein